MEDVKDTMRKIYEEGQSKIKKSYEDTIQHMGELVNKQYYYISFIVKNPSTGNMKEWVIVHCEAKDLANEINNHINQLKKKYQDVQADTVTKL